MLDALLSAHGSTVTAAALAPRLGSDGLTPACGCWRDSYARSWRMTPRIRAICSPHTAAVIIGSSETSPRSANLRDSGRGGTHRATAGGAVRRCPARAGGDRAVRRRAAVPGSRAAPAAGLRPDRGDRATGCPPVSPAGWAASGDRDRRHPSPIPAAAPAGRRSGWRSRSAGIGTCAGGPRGGLLVEDLLAAGASGAAVLDARLRALAGTLAYHQTAYARAMDRYQDAG